MKAHQAHAVIALRQKGAEHLLLDEMIDYPLNKEVDPAVDALLKTLCQQNGIEISHYYPHHLEAEI